MNDMHDGSQRMEELHELREKARQFDTLLGNINGMAYRCKHDPNWTMIYVSAGSNMLTGYAPEDLIDNRTVAFADLISEPYRDEVWESIQEAVAAGDKYTLQYSIETADGAHKWVWEQGCAVRNAQGEVIALEGFITDITALHQTEQTLRESERRYRLLADNTLDVIWVMDLDTRFTYVNQAITNMFGYTPEEWIGTCLAEHCDSEQMAYMQDIIDRDLLLAGEHPGVIFETIMRHRDGSPVWVEIHGAFLYDEHGRPTSIQGTTRDIRIRKQVERELKENEARYRRFISNIHDVIVILDTDLTIRYTSPNITRHFGWGPEELIGRDGWETVHPDDKAYMARELRTLLAKEGNTGTVQYRFLRKDGSYTYIELFAVNMMNDPIIQGILGNHHDITEQRETEMAIRESEEKFRLAFKTSPDSININKLDGTFVEINDGFTRMTGYTEEDVIGKKSIELGIWVHPEERKTMIAELEEHGTAQNLQVDFRFKDGTTMIGMMSASIIQINHEPHILSITRDISERVRLEEQLRQAQKMEAIGRLAGGVAHDFNNMLNVILGNAELILASIEEHHRLYADIQEIIKAGQRSAGLTRQLLAFSRKQIVSPKIVNINEMVAEQKRMLHRLIGEDIEIITRLADDLWRVRIDPSQIDQILANFIVNARDAIPGVGTITIETANVMLDNSFDTRDYVATPGGYVMLTCRDSGIGMDEETRLRVFEPFFTTKVEGKGTGLGLATVYGIVKQNDGYIDVISEPGKGTEFRVYLPRVEGETVKKASSKMRLSLTGNETVLIVEDEIQVLNLARRVLTRYGYDVLTANTVDEAIAQVTATKEDIHLLLSDVVMPAMNGKELRAKIELLRPGIKTLFMSGYTADVIAHRGVIDEGVEFIQKPFATIELAEKVRSVLDAE